MTDKDRLTDKESIDGQGIDRRTRHRLTGKARTRSTDKALIDGQGKDKELIDGQVHRLTDKESIDGQGNYKTL